MTVLTKPSMNSMKPVETKSPLVIDVDVDDGEHEMVPQSWSYRKRSIGALVYMVVAVTMLVIVGVSGGFLLYRQYQNIPSRRYQAYCTIPYRRPSPGADFVHANTDNLLMPLHWTSSPDVQVLATGANDKDPDSDNDSELLLNSLNEEFDITGRVERIRVYDKDRSVSFIHVFDENVTGIVDSERCFLTALDKHHVLPPEELVPGMERDQLFDVTPAHSALHAELPALNAMDLVTSIIECLNKPVYRLQKDEAAGIRKRSVDGPPSDYVHFAGRQVQEIQITNLGELLQHEQDLRTRT